MHFSYIFAQVFYKIGQKNPSVSADTDGREKAGLIRSTGTPPGGGEENDEQGKDLQAAEQHDEGQ